MYNLTIVWTSSSIQSEMTESLISRYIHVSAKLNIIRCNPTSKTGHRSPLASLIHLINIAIHAVFMFKKLISSELIQAMSPLCVNSVEFHLPVVYKLLSRSIAHFILQTRNIILRFIICDYIKRCQHFMTTTWPSPCPCGWSPTCPDKNFMINSVW